MRTGFPVVESRFASYLSNDSFTDAPGAVVKDLALHWAALRQRSTVVNRKFILPAENCLKIENQLLNTVEPRYECYQNQRI